MLFFSSLRSVLGAAQPFLNHRGLLLTWLASPADPDPCKSLPQANAMGGSDCYVVGE